MNMHRLVLRIMHLIRRFPREAEEAGTGSAPALLLRTYKAQIPPPSLPITVNLQNASLAPLKYNSLIFTEPRVMPVASLDGKVGRSRGPSGVRAGLALAWEIASGPSILDFELGLSGAPAAEKLPGCAIYL